ncbi:hypothetical protein VNO77_28018 [Canavalia gladiata]|uniref:F-box domain-containing protein n=1 Tax=Canavalia gladiata TaxID=3824 RepID=A0AAN9KZY4_CANGL
MSLFNPSSSTPNTSHGRIRKGPNKEKLMKTDTNGDFINNLPDEILVNILSKLRIDEAVRCDVLSKRWFGLWKQTSHMEFDVRHMVNPLTKLLQSREARTVPDFNTLGPSINKIGYGFFSRVILLILTHSSILSSCHFRHFKKSLVFGDVETCIDFFLDRKKGIKDLCLECVSEGEEGAEKFVFHENVYTPTFPCGIFENLASLELINYTIECWLPFQECRQLKKLKLKRVYLDNITLSGILENCVVLENFMLLECNGLGRVLIVKSKLKVLQLQALCVGEIDIVTNSLEVLLLDSMICPVKDVRIYAPYLKTFRSYNYSIYARMVAANGENSIAKTHQIFAQCSDLVMGPTTRSIFQNLSTLSIDLDLNNLREAGLLSYVMRLCKHLRAIDIYLPVFRPRITHKSIICSSDILCLMSTFWEKRESCCCISQKLKFVSVRGFRGKEHELKFAKYVITKAIMLKRITIICSDSMTKAETLFSLPRASGNLFINLKLNANNPMDEFAEHQNRMLKW